MELVALGIVAFWRPITAVALATLALVWAAEHFWIASGIVAALALLGWMATRSAPEAPKPAASVYQRSNDARRAAIRARFKRRMAG